MSTAWPAAFMNAMACAAWPSAAAPCPRWPTAVLCGSPCRTRRSGRTTSLRPRCWGWRRSTPACPKFSSPAPTTTRPCWPAMPTRCAGRTALPARRPRRCIWPISGSLLRPAAPRGCAHRRPWRCARRMPCRRCRLAGRSSPSPRTKRPTPAAISRGGARCISFRTPPGCGSSLPPRRGAVILAAGSCRSTSPARTRGSGSSTPTARRTAVCRGLCRASPFCRSARPRAPATTPPCWWSRPGRTRRCWMPCAAFCRRRAGMALPILI